MKGVIRGDQNIQGQRGQTNSMAVRSMFSEWGIKLTQYWKYEGFGSLDYALLMCEMMDPSTSRSVRLECAGAMKGKCER